MEFVKLVEVAKHFNILGVKKSNVESPGKSNLVSTDMMWYCTPFFLHVL